MIEKVNPSHPDKLADRIAGAIVDIGYKKNENPKVAVEVLLGHGICHIIIESSESFYHEEILPIVDRIVGEPQILDLVVVPQDHHLAENQSEKIRCGDNGIFRGVPLTREEKNISFYARDIYDRYKTDGKYILDKNKLIICQSNATEKPAGSQSGSRSDKRRGQSKRPPSRSSRRGTFRSGAASFPCR